MRDREGSRPRRHRAARQRVMPDPTRGRPWPRGSAYLSSSHLAAGREANDSELDNEREKERDRETMILPPSLRFRLAPLPGNCCRAARKHARTHTARAARPCVRPSRCGALISFFRPLFTVPQPRNSTPPPRPSLPSSSRMRWAKTVLLVAATAAAAARPPGGSKLFHFRRMTGGAAARKAKPSPVRLS